jgi:sigma-B regulation protein RsbU (phosphoserine phosphatase)
MDQVSALQHEVQQLRKAVEELSILNDLSRVISSTMSLDEVIKNIVNRAVKAVHGQQGMITLVDEQSPNEMKTLIRTQDSGTNQPQFRLTQSILGWMLLNKKPLTSDNLAADSRFQIGNVENNLRSLVAVPLLVKSRIIGILAVFNKKSDATFSEDDKRLLSIIATHSGQILENARLLEQEKSLITMREQLKLASDIQQQLLPTKAPALEAYDIAGRSLPAQEIGGDYFDFIPVNEERLAVCLGDVTGKGLPASLLMANVQATIRGQSLIDQPPKDCIIRSNKLLFQSTSPEKFVTFFYAILNTQQHILSFSNAGHDSPYVFRENGEIHRLKTGGVVLGIMDFFPFDEESLQLQLNDCIVIYSDGLPEAMNQNRELLGDERLCALLQKYRTMSANDMIDRVFSEIKEYAGPYPQSDDMTMVVIKRTK